MQKSVIQPYVYHSCSIIDHWWPMGNIFHWLLMAVMVGLVSTQHNKVRWAPALGSRGALVEKLQLIFSCPKKHQLICHQWWQYNNKCNLRHCPKMYFSQDDNSFWWFTWSWGSPRWRRLWWRGRCRWLGRGAWPRTGPTCTLETLSTG